MKSSQTQILVLGATGFVGGRLVPYLSKQGHDVRCLVRNLPESAKMFGKEIELLEGDVFNYEQLKAACKDCENIVYLIHSMGTSEKSFESLDIKAAQNLINAARESETKRIIYLGGLGKKHENQSAHLKSRHDVGDTLRSGNVPVTEFRAAVIAGNGGVSFEMIHHLTNRLPAMICPRWVSTRTQPIAISDVVRYISQSLSMDETIGKTYDIGGPEVLTYGDMMKQVADVLKLKRLMIKAPVLTPRLSSYWVNLVTPINSSVARSLIEGLRSETICENDNAIETFEFEPMPFKKAAQIAFQNITDNRIEVDKEDVILILGNGIDSSHIKIDRQIVNAGVSDSKLFKSIIKIGGENGWYYGNWLWRLRGFIDRFLGGVGLRMTKNNCRKMAAGEKLDFWIIRKYIENKVLLLEAEMKVWGQARLEFEVQKGKMGTSILVQTARYYPRGLFAHIYWYSILPIHKLLFRGMAKQIVKRACNA